MMASQLHLLDSPQDMTSLPTAKVKGADKTGVHAWTPFYASFSETFALKAIQSLAPDPNDLVFDPFVGSGTTLIAAMKLGLAARGNDLDPFACLLSRAKIAFKADPKDVRKLLQGSKAKKSKCQFPDAAREIFTEECLAYASAVFEKVLTRTDTDSAGVLGTLLRDKQGAFDSEIVALVAVAIGGATASKLIRGSNPTWYRQAIAGEISEIAALREATLSTAELMLNDLAEAPPVSKLDIILTNSDLKDLRPSPRGRLHDIVLTSPPYLTRMDYVVKHLPHLLILSGLIQIDIDHLRRKMLGTPKIVEKGSFNALWGRQCITCLDAIKSHESYASGNYYVWNYYQYFKTLYSCLVSMTSQLSPSARGLIVVQGSYYKDVPIDLSKIVVEMLENIGLGGRVVSRDKVKTSMRDINPARSGKAPAASSSEDIVYFSRR